MNRHKAKALAEKLALQYAEKYGITEYKVVNHKMIYYTSFPLERSTYKCIVDLTNSSEKRIKMKKYYYPWKYIGKIQVNYNI